jgi:uncharacterized protein (TIGR02452 family)
MIQIYDNTRKYFLEGPSKFILPSTLYDIKNIHLNRNSMNTHCVTYIIQNIDSLDMAKNFHNEGLNPLVLNMASAYRPGGGVQSGKTAQEEVIFRRTNAFMTHPRSWYPLKNYQVIYSVHVIKNLNYQLLDENDQYTVSMIAVAAIRKPKLVLNSYQKKDAELIYDKIRSIFKIAIKEGHDSLILGALGCGAYHNPPDEVAKIFRRLSAEYGKYFKKIGLAILIVRYTDKKNIDAFTDEFKNI